MHTSASTINEPTISLIVIDQHGVIEELDGVWQNQPLLELALRLDARLQPQQNPSSPQQAPPPQLPEVDLLSLDGETLPLLSTPASSSLVDGGRLYCYRYGEACREYQKGHSSPGTSFAATASMACGPEASVAKPVSGPKYVGLYLSDWMCGYQRRMLLHHDLSLPFEVLLQPFCNMRGLRAEDASFVWLQFYRKVRFEDTGKGMDIEDGDCIFAYSNKQDQGKLWDAVFSKDINQVEAALAAGATLDFGPKSMEYLMGGRYPLHVAAAENQAEIIRLLVDRGACVNQLDAASEPALWHAIENGNEAAMRALLDLGATADDIFPVASSSSTDLTGGTGASSRGSTSKDGQYYAALAHCASRGHTAGMRMLMERSCNLHAQDQDGYTSYDYVIDHGGPLDILQTMLEHDKIFTRVQDQYQEQYVRLCQILKKAHRYPQSLGCPCRSCNSLVEVRATENDLSRAIKAEIGCVAMVRVVQGGKTTSVEMLQLLHHHGAPLNGQDSDGRTALHQAARFNRVAEAKWLLEMGARADIADFEGLLPLHQAACSGNIDIARLLVEHVAPINQHTIKYITQESLEAQAKRLDASTNSNSKKPGSGKRRAPPLDTSGLVTIGGNSSLALAVRHGSTAVVEYLLQEGAAFDLKNAADSSAFNAALERGAAAIANLLMMPRKSSGWKGGISSSSTSLSIATVKGTAKASVVKSKSKASTENGVKEVKAIVLQEKEKQAERKNGKVKSSSRTTLATQGDSQSKVLSSITAPPFPDPEPAMAHDAGSVFLQQMAEERERLRQKLGLSRPVILTSAVSSLPSISEQLLARPAPKPTAVQLPESSTPLMSAQHRSAAEVQRSAILSTVSVEYPNSDTSSNYPIAAPIVKEDSSKPETSEMVSSQALSMSLHSLSHSSSLDPEPLNESLPSTSQTFASNFSSIAARNGQQVRCTAIFEADKTATVLVAPKPKVSVSQAPKGFSEGTVAVQPEACPKVESPSVVASNVEGGAPMTKGVQILFRRTPQEPPVTVIPKEPPQIFGVQSNISSTAASSIALSSQASPLSLPLLTDAHKPSSSANQYQSKQLSRPSMPASDLARAAATAAIHSVPPSRAAATAAIHSVPPSRAAATAAIHCVPLSRCAPPMSVSSEAVQLSSNSSVGSVVATKSKSVFMAPSAIISDTGSKYASSSAPPKTQTRRRKASATPLDEIQQALEPNPGLLMSRESGMVKPNLISAMSGLRCNVSLRSSVPGQERRDVMDPTGQRTSRATGAGILVGNSADAVIAVIDPHVVMAPQAAASSSYSGEWVSSVQSSSMPNKDGCAHQRNPAEPPTSPSSIYHHLEDMVAAVMADEDPLGKEGVGLITSRMLESGLVGTGGEKDSPRSVQRTFHVNEWSPHLANVSVLAGVGVGGASFLNGEGGGILQGWGSEPLLGSSDHTLGSGANLCPLPRPGSLHDQGNMHDMSSRPTAGLRNMSRSAWGVAGGMTTSAVEAMAVAGGGGAVHRQYNSASWGISVHDGAIDASSRLALANVCPVGTGAMLPSVDAGQVDCWSSGLMQGSQLVEVSNQQQELKQSGESRKGLAQEAAYKSLWTSSSSCHQIHQPRVVDLTSSAGVQHRYQDLALPDLPASLFDDPPASSLFERDEEDLRYQMILDQQQTNQQPPSRGGLLDNQQLPQQQQQQFQQQQAYFLRPGGMFEPSQQQHSTKVDGLTRHMQQQQQLVFEQMQQQHHVHYVEWQNASMQYGPPSAGWDGVASMPPNGYLPTTLPHNGSGLGQSLPIMPLDPPGLGQGHCHPSSVFQYHQHQQQQFDHHYHQQQLQHLGYLMSGGSNGEPKSQQHSNSRQQH